MQLHEDSTTRSQQRFCCYAQYHHLFFGTYLNGTNPAARAVKESLLWAGNWGMSLATLRGLIGALSGVESLFPAIAPNKVSGSPNNIHIDTMDPIVSPDNACVVR